MSVHPSARILLYVISALALPGLNLFGLAILAGLLLLGQGFNSWRGARAGLDLLWRTKWLFLVMFVAYAHALPGAPLVDALGEYSPSREGVVAATVQMARLILLLLMLEWMVLRMGTTEIISGLYPILARFERLGVEAERATVRLALTLAAIDARRARGQEARRLWRWPPDPGDLPAEPLFLYCRPWRALDRWALALAGLTWGVIWLYGSR